MARQQGTLLMVAAILLLGIAGLAFALSFAAAGSAAQRDRVTERALAQAREALIAYAVDRAITAEVGPGYLPCPDLDDDGWAEATCGSMNGDSGQAQRLGRLPWKTLGLADLRDGAGERLWYAVSSKHKGLLNCAASRACVDMSPDAALGTISVRDRSGTLLHDGTIAEPYRANEGGAVAVIIAPGAPLTRANTDGTPGAEQRRDCAPGDCDLLGRCTTDPPQRAARCDPRNFLDNAPAAGFPGEDNADFVDRNDGAGRARNANGFIHGPVVLGDGRVAVNDRLAVISYRDLMPRVMARVALEVARCLRDYAARPENGGRYPWPAPVCAQASPDPSVAWRGEAGALFGRVPDTPFTEAATRRMLERWWRAAPHAPEDFAGLPTRDQACHIAIAPDDAGTARTTPPPSPAEEGETAGHSGNAWWTPWKPFVFYALARAYAPSSAPSAGCGDSGQCIEVADLSGAAIARGKQFAVLVAGAPLAREGSLQSHAAASIGDPRQWLEEANARLASASSCAGIGPCAEGACNRVVSAAAARGFNDVAYAFP
jgi:type II secretory pathway pseudopilin PulG